MKNFDVNKLTNDEAKAIVRSLATGFQATIQKQQTSSEKLISTLELDLSIARTRSNALKVSFPFISVRVESASDVQASCRIIPVDVADYQDDTLLKLNDSLEFDNGISNVFITNVAQPNKKMILKFYTTARVRSGSMVLDQNSVVNNITVGEATAQNDGFTFTLISTVTMSPLNTNTMLTVECYNDYSMMNGRAGLSFAQSNFRVPMGYTAEIIGAEIKVIAAIGSTAWGIDYAQFNQNQSMSPATYAASNVGVAKLGFGPLPVNNTFVKAPVLYGVYGTGFLPNNSKRIITEGKVLVMTTFNSTSTTTGVAELITMIRLTRNVGA